VDRFFLLIFQRREGRQFALLCATSARSASRRWAFSRL